MGFNRALERLPKPRTLVQGASKEDRIVTKRPIVVRLGMGNLTRHTARQLWTIRTHAVRQALSEGSSVTEKVRRLPFVFEYCLRRELCD